jgi:hypothetical protein
VEGIDRKTVKTVFSFYNHMYKRMPPYEDYDHMGESINLVDNFKVDKVIFR